MNAAMIGAGAAMLSAGLLAGCGMGEPASAEYVENLMREDSVEDGFEVSWVHAEPQEEVGHFRTFVDRVKPDEEDSDETWMCNVRATTASRSWTCQSLTPGLIAQAVAMLEEQYTERNLEVIDYDIDRSGEGLDFAGHIMLREPRSGERARVPCTGSQEGTRFDIDCSQQGAEILPPEGGAAPTAPAKG